MSDKPLIISASDASMFNWAELWWQHHTTRFPDHDFRMYDLGGLGFGEPFAVQPDEIATDYSKGECGLPRCTFKPRLICHVLETDNRPVLWLDSDAYLMHDRLHRIANADAAVTIKRRTEIAKLRASGELWWAGTVNCGVVLVRNIQFAREWLEHTLRRQADQPGMVDTIGHCWRSHGVVQRAGCRVRLLTTERWNCYYFSEENVVQSARVIHFKGREFKLLQPRDFGIG